MFMLEGINVGEDLGTWIKAGGKQVIVFASVAANQPRLILDFYSLVHYKLDS